MNEIVCIYLFFVNFPVPASRLCESHWQYLSHGIQVSCGVAAMCPAAHSQRKTWVRMFCFIISSTAVDFSLHNLSFKTNCCSYNTNSEIVHVRFISCMGNMTSNSSKLELLIYRQFFRVFRVSVVGSPLYLLNHAVSYCLFVFTSQWPLRTVATSKWAYSRLSCLMIDVVTL